MSDYICNTHQWRLNNDDSPCPFREIDRLKAEMERVLVNSAEMMQNQSNGMLKLMEENRDLERQLAEARVETASLLQNDCTTCAGKNLTEIIEQARQDAAREIIQYMVDQGVIDAGTISRPMLVYEIAECDITELKQRFRLEG